MSSPASSRQTAVEEYTSAKSLVNLRKQAKYIAIGAILTWYFQVAAHLHDALSLGVSSNWNARIALIAVSLLFATLVIFAYIILLPARGHSPDYVRWQQDAHLRSAIPALTLFIIAGFLSLLLTLSPLGAPAPPAASLTSRLTQAATVAGSNLNAASRGVQQLAAKSFGLSSSPSSSEKLLELLHLDSFDSLASRLGVSSSRSGELSNAFGSLTRRAEEWAQGNVRAIGWTGALFASSGTYLLVFGCVGLLGFLAPDRSAKARVAKKKEF